MDENKVESEIVFSVNFEHDYSIVYIKEKEGVENIYSEFFLDGVYFEDNNIECEALSVGIYKGVLTAIFYEDYDYYIGSREYSVDLKITNIQKIEIP